MTDTYEQARTERSRPLLATRTADTQAAFLLPHLRPGMDLLDVGCGPGTITVGLAAAVAPGRTIGLDLPHALPPPAEGVEYVAGDATELPFPDASFDAIAPCCNICPSRWSPCGRPAAWRGPAR